MPWATSGNIRGPQGPTGPQGPQGQGVHRDPAPPAAPAEQWLWFDTDDSAESYGITGPQGPQGPQGPAGSQGATGPQGPQGSNSVLIGADTRTTDPAPSTFAEANRHFAPDFKAGSSIGLPGAFYGLETISPWGDDTGGGVHQIAYGNGGSGDIWHRYGTRSAGWGPWRPFDAGDTGWHAVGAAGEPAFQNGWTNYTATGDSNWEEAAFRKHSNGLVELKGLVRAGTMDTIVFQLPVGYRPAKGVHVMTISNAAPGGIRIVGTDTGHPGPPGSIYLGSPGSNAWFSLRIPLFLGEK